MRFGFGLVLAVGMLLGGCGLAAAAAANTSVPAQAYHLPPEKLAKAIRLGRTELAIHFGAELWNVAALWLLLATGLAARLGGRVQRMTRNSWSQGGIYGAAVVAILFVAVEAPAAAIGHAVSLSYGISVERWAPWLLDLAKSFALAVALETPLLMLVFGMLRWFPRRYWLWFWAAMVPVSIFGAVLLPAVIDPLFNKFEPLAASHPALVAQLERVVERTGTSIPPERMFLMKASEKSNGLNAYVTGLGSTKRIVVWDTTADRMPQDQILFTFAHESGHYVLNHVAKGLAAGAVGMFIGLWLVAKLSEWLVVRCGARWQVDRLASLPGLVLVLLVVALLQIVAEPVENTASRYIEHQADVYGQEAMHGIVADPQRTAVAAFNSLGEAYLDDPDPNGLVELWSYDHPSLKRRAAFAARYNPWLPGRTPRFFSR